MRVIGNSYGLGRNARAGSCAKPAAGGCYMNSGCGKWALPRVLDASDHNGTAGYGSRG